MHRINQTLVSVQPMAAPLGAIFLMELIYRSAEDQALEQVITEWLQTAVTYGDERDLERASRVVEDWPFNDKSYFAPGSHEFVSRLLANPCISFERWLEFSWVNPDAALQNPVVALWLLEDPTCLQRLKIGKLKFLLTSKYYPVADLQQLWTSTKTPNGLLSCVVECPVTPTAWLVEYRKARWGRDYDPIAREVENELDSRGVLTALVLEMMPKET